MNRLAYPLPVLQLLFAGILGCEDTDLNQGKPIIQVVPEAVAFQTINVGESDTKEIVVGSTGTAPLKIAGLTIEGGAQFDLKTWDGKPLSEVDFPYGIPQAGSGLGTERTLALAFTPESQGEFSDVLVITSNAEGTPEVRVSLLGRCSVPDIEPSPLLLDFGIVPLESSASLDLTLRNVGATDLIIPAQGLDLVRGGQDSPFLFQEMAQEARIPQDGQRVVEVIYTPREPEIDPVTHQKIPHQDTLRIRSNDPDENPLEIPLRGRVLSDLPPYAALRIAKVTRLDGSELAEPCEIAPSDLIVWQARVLDPEGEVIPAANLIWRVEGAPPGNSRDISPDDSPALTARFQPGLTGEYVVCVKAKDANGNDSACDPASPCGCEEAQAAPDGDFGCPCVRFQALPREDIRIELTWDRIGPDLDLHLLAPGGVFCSPTDCYWDGRNPDWGIPGDDSDDPMLAIDCTKSCRSENINLNHPAAGSYEILVNDFEYSTDSQATIRIYFKGDVTPSAEFTSLMTAGAASPCNDTWRVATIEWIDEDNHPVAPLDTHTCMSCK